MPEVIVDTSPLQYLYQLGYLTLLPILYKQLTIPNAVINELKQGQAKGLALPTIAEYSWATVKKPQRPILLPLASGLGAGESEVLALTQETSQTLAILDDRRARQYARLLGVSFTGTLGVLLKAKQIGELSALRPITEKLLTLGFRIDPKTIRAVLRLADEAP